MSYYLKGSVVGFLLDLSCAGEAGARTLDDSVRALFEKHGAPPGLPEDGVERAAVELLGDPSLRDWFARAVRSTQELDLDEALGAVAFEAVLAQAKGTDDKGSAQADPSESPDAAAQSRAWLGAALRERSGALEIGSVAEGSPAQLAGVCAGDEVVAIDGFLLRAQAAALPRSPARPSGSRSSAWTNCWRSRWRSARRRATR